MDPNAKEYSNKITLANKVGAEDFDDLVFDDINELLVDNVLSEDEILHFASDNADFVENRDDDKESVELTANSIREGLQLAGYHFIKNDCNAEWAA